MIEAPFEEALLIGHDKLPRNGNGSAAPGDAVIPDSGGVLAGLAYILLDDLAVVAPLAVPVNRSTARMEQPSVRSAMMATRLSKGRAFMGPIPVLRDWRRSD